MMVDREKCGAGHRNPYSSCGCHSASEQPCRWCDWHTYHGDCEGEADDGIDNPPTKEMFVTPDEAADEIERLRTLLDNALERENKDNERQLQIVRKVKADRDRWLKIAMFNLTAIYGDQTQHHIDTCYEADGTYHGGAHGDR